MSSEITVGIVNFNGRETIGSVIASIRRQDVPVDRLLVVDNASTDGSREWIAAHHPEIDLIAFPENRGPAAARNRLLQKARTPFLFLLDNDIVLESDVCRKLLRILHMHPDIALCHPEIRDEADPSAYHYNGGWIHYLGAFISREKPDPVRPRPEFEIFDTVSGAAMLVRRRDALDVGGFDEAYVFNWEDGDFCIRLTLSGRKCVNVPEAVVHHRGKPRGMAKVYYQARNRWMFLLKFFEWPTLLLSLPMLALFEVAQLGFVCLKGFGGAYLRGLRDAVRMLPALLKKRKAFFRWKRRKDAEWLRSGEMFVSGNLKASQTAAQCMDILNRIFDLWWDAIVLPCLKRRPSDKRPWFRLPPAP
ncbi:glycosyltransferase family 2 protein [Desulfatirhabdium butyrativorans]|uniref:glycosyltransferase family 2 protein n=1 Tax=Desulfatirhabdium butyrativorans TaxID=340467 RepID=UPI0003FE69D0|nr:glycosyltransferase family 2 protein [Desulfatirhabdium butyrativorans]